MSIVSSPIAEPNLPQRAISLFIDLYRSTGYDVLDSLLACMDWPTFLALMKTSASTHAILRGCGSWQQSHWEGNRALNTIFRQRRNVFLTGGGGVGKSHTVGRIMHHAKALGLKAACVSTTAASAALIGGITLHSFFGIGLYKNMSSFLASPRGIAASKGGNDTAKAIKELDILVVDEVSALGANVLALADYVARKAKGRELPFGGLQIVAVGDLYQLPPVREKRAIGSHIWRELDLLLHEFTHSVRQSGDLRFRHLLHRAREGHLTPGDRIMLAEREDLALPEGITYLYSTNMETKAHNRQEYDKVDAEESILPAIDMAMEYIPPLAPNMAGKWEPTIAVTVDQLRADLKKQLYRLPTKLRCKQGAQYYITCNINQNEGIINGAACTLLGIEFDVVYGEVAKVRLHKSGNVVIVPPVRNSFRTLVDGKTYALRRDQIPLKLGYAMTIHYSQGATLDKAYMDYTRVNSCAQFYVGLSRVRDIGSLYLKGFSGKRFVASQEVRTYYRTARRSHVPYEAPTLEYLDELEERDCSVNAPKAKSNASLTAKSRLLAEYGVHSTVKKSTVITSRARGPQRKSKAEKGSKA